MLDLVIIKMGGEIRGKIELFFELNRLKWVPVFVTKQIG